MVIIYCALLFACVVAAATEAWLRTRRHRAMIVLQTLAAIMSRNLPLAPALRATAQAERRKLRRAYERLAARLERGDDLSRALRAVVPASQSDALGAVEGAEEGGTLPAVLKDVTARAQRDLVIASENRFPLWYPLILLVIVPTMLTFVSVMVIPRYAKIFQDFETALPAITHSLIEFTSFIGRYAAAISVLLGLILLGFLHAALGRHFIPRRSQNVNPLYVVGDTIFWFLPGLRQLCGHAALSRQLPLLQAAIRAGADLPEAARQAACVPVNVHARWRILAWARAVEQGDAPAAAAARAGMPAPVARAFSTARGPAELAGALEYLADYYESLRRHWVRVLGALLTPMLVAVWAIVIGWVVLALFLPLVTLIQSVSASAY